ncbi:MAG: hypothetical protein ACOY3Y_19095 [Acidobacteriota bacterium]
MATRSEGVEDAMRKLVPLALLLATAAVGAGAEDFVLPAFAWHLPGSADNRWTSEVYVTNPTSVPASLTVGAPILGRQKLIHACLPPTVTVPIEPLSTAVVPAFNVAVALGCPDEFVGGLILQADEWLVINSRMTNERGAGGDDPQGLLTGFGQEIPGVPWDELPARGATYMLPSLLAHPNACEARRYESAIHFANPNPAPVEVTFVGPAGAAVELVIDNALVTTPKSFTLAAQAWVQVKLRVPDSMLTVCGVPTSFDVFFQVSDRTGVMASVVDRTTQDPRTVMPVLVR